MSAYKLFDFESWRVSSVAENEFQVQPISFAESEEWSFRDGRLVHRSGGFFELVGLRTEARHPYLDGQEQLIIRQRKIAINGLLIRHTAEECEALLQGRVEPGNVGGMQLAPTVQSTEANYRRLHGGKPTAFIDYFIADDATFVYDVLQSEEGSRYHGKYNRNTVRLLGTEELESHANYRWVPFEQIKRAVETPNILNTDCRSLLFCLDWKYLTWPRTPFSVAKSDISLLMARSYSQPLWETGTPPFEALAWLARLRAAAGIVSEAVLLEKLKNWAIENDRIIERERDLGFCVRQFRVVSRQREVPSWDQPLIDSATRGRITLLCQWRDGVLQFLVAASYEIGFLEGVQLSATIVVPPGRNDDSLPPACRRLLDMAGADTASTLIASCLQSEEGGRFYRDENHYEIVMLDPAAEIPHSDEHRWMTLSQITALKSVAGVFAIELRCILFLLFKFL